MAETLEKSDFVTDRRIATFEGRLANKSALIQKLDYNCAKRDSRRPSVGEPMQLPRPPGQPQPQLVKSNCQQQ
jgi:hypothetical protein